MKYDLTFLTKEQCIDKPINVIKKYGTGARLTDFARVLRGSTDQLWANKNPIRKQNCKAGRIGYYWTKTIDMNYRYQKAAVYYMAYYGECINWVGDRGIGIRPAMRIPSINKIREMINEKNGNVFEIEYGFYPQNMVSIKENEILESLFEDNMLVKTERTYMINSGRNYDVSFYERIQEYEYNNNKYVRLRIVTMYDSILLTNGKRYFNGEYVWIKVRPVNWLVDLDENIMVTEKIIFSGIEYNNDFEYCRRLDFLDTDIKKFMDDNLARDLFQDDFNSYNDDENDNIKKNKIIMQFNKNPYNFDFSEIDDINLIKYAIKSNVSIFLHGKPGCGKSDRIKKLDSNFIELNLNHMDPELLDGLSGEKNGHAVHIKPCWLEELELICNKEPNKLHLLFLDEISNASSIMQAKAYGIVLDKKVAGRWKLPENARVVAAGNDIEDSLVANEIAEPLYDRFAHIKIQTQKEDWLKWALSKEDDNLELEFIKENNKRKKIHPVIYAFIQCYGDTLLRTEFDVNNPEPYANPRRWKMASDILYESNNPNVLRIVIGEDLTNQFIEFCKLSVITVNDIINNEYSQDEIDEMSFDEKIIATTELLNVESKDLEKVRGFVDKLGQDMLNIFDNELAQVNNDENVDSFSNNDELTENENNINNLELEYNNEEENNNIELEFSSEDNVNNINLIIDNDNIEGNGIGAGNSIQRNRKKVPKTEKKTSIINWKKLLKQNVKLDEDYTRKNARMKDDFLKTKINPIEIPETEIILDVSGSVSEKMLKNFLRECKFLIEQSNVKVGCFNTEFHGFEKIKNVKDIDNLYLPIGGGTNFNVAVEGFSKRVENKIIFTDGEASMPETNIKNVIWVVYGNEKINPIGGKVINITDEQLMKLKM